MSNPDSAPSVVVGVDGSKAAAYAALWAVDEAVSRDIPLRLLYVIDPLGIGGPDTDDARYVAARAALSDVDRAVSNTGEATGKQVKVETEIRWGRPHEVLIEQSRWAAMVCVGSIGLKHACHGVGSVAAALGGWAHCPVAVIGRPAPRPDVGSVVVEVGDALALRHAFDEARLRAAPLRAVCSCRQDSYRDEPGGVAGGKRLAHRRLDRRLARWTHLYPDVRVEPIVIRGGVRRYLATSATSVQLLVTGQRAYRDLSSADNQRCSVLTVRSTNL